MSNKTIWKIIRECCETDSDTAVLLLEAAEMGCENNLRKVFLLNVPEYIFRVPNYCICDPLYERDYETLKNNLKNIQEKKIHIICFYLDKNINVELDVTNKMKVKDIKTLFANNINVDTQKFKIRFLFKGQELIDDNLLCYNNIDNMSKIQVMINPIE